jgi:hypothetical protein
MSTTEKWREMNTRHEKNWKYKVEEMWRMRYRHTAQSYFWFYLFRVFDYNLENVQRRGEKQQQNPLFKKNIYFLLPTKRLGCEWKWWPLCVHTHKKEVESTPRAFWTFLQLPTVGCTRTHSPHTHRKKERKKEFRLQQVSLSLRMLHRR